MTTAPLVSIVMPSLNQASFLSDALDSILRQDHSTLEIIVADGGSSDGTLDMLRDRSAQDRRLRWSSERDSGPAQALNRALAKVRGTIVGWLNADDLFTAGAIGRAVAGFESNRDWIMLYGQAEHVDEKGVPIARYPTLAPAGPIRRFANGCFICQPTVFFRQTMPILLGPLDESLHASFDFDYWVRAFTSFPDRIGFVDVVQAQSRLHAGGITARLRRTVAIEGMRIVAGAFGSAPSHWLTTYMEEVMAAPASHRPTDLRAHFLETLDEVTPNLDAMDAMHLRAAIQRDSRL